MTIKHLQKQVNMSRKKVMQNDNRAGVEKTFDNVCVNTFGFCISSKLTWGWRYVSAVACEQQRHRPACAAVQSVQHHW